MKEELDLDSAINWVAESGVQNANGGFYAWYDCEKGCYSYLYPEITGYAIQFLVEFYKLTGRSVFLRKAYAAADWLLGIQRKDGAFNCKYYIESGEVDRSSYVFDAGICLSGLLSLFEVTLDEKLLKPSLGVADWLLKSQNPDGSFVAGYDSRNAVIEDHHWSRTSACHHIKNLVLFQKLHRILQDRKYSDSADRLLKWGLGLQEDSGRFCISYRLKGTYTHSHCYAVEGLLKATKLIGGEALSERIIHAARWLSNVQNKDGSIWNYHLCKQAGNDRIKVSEALAQSIRIWRVTGECFDVGNEFEANIEKGLSFLGKMQCRNHDRSSFGGIYYGEKDGEKIRHVNAWATLFTIQAATFMKDRGGNPSSLDALF